MTAKPKNPADPTPDQSRAQRVNHLVGEIVDDAIIDAMRPLDHLVDRGDATEAEVVDALKYWPDFADVRILWVAAS